MQSFHESLNFFQQQEQEVSNKMGKKFKNGTKSQKPTRNGGVNHKETISCISKELYDSPVSKK